MTRRKRTETQEATRVTVQTLEMKLQEQALAFHKNWGQDVKLLLLAKLLHKEVRSAFKTPIRSKFFCSREAINIANLEEDKGGFLSVLGQRN